MRAQGGEGNPPVFIRVAISDYAGAMLSAFGVTMALFHRARAGVGQRVEASLLNGAVAAQAIEFFSYPGMQPPPRAGTKGRTACYRLYKGLDDWFFLSCRDGDSFARVCRLVGRSDLCQRFPDENRRLAHDPEIGAALEEAFATRKREHWLSGLHVLGVKCAPCHRMTDCHGDPQAVHQGLTVDALSPDIGPIKQMGLPFKFSHTPGKIWGPAPAHGQHTDEILSQMGIAPDAIASLREKGVVG